MRLLPILACVGALVAGSAFAATSPSSAPVTATAPANANAASPSTESNAAKHTAKECEKQATEKKLAGDAKKSFMKDCKAGKQ